MKILKLFVLLALELNMIRPLVAQDLIATELTLDQVIELAREQSPSAILAKYKFRVSHWEFRAYKAELKPNVTLNATLPEFNRQIKKYQNSDGSYTYVEDNLNISTIGFNLIQNVGYTGGQIFASSYLSRLDVFGSNAESSYLSSPISIGYLQPVLFYNEYKWQKKIEPLKYEEAKKEYLSSLEEVSIKAVAYFFDLALAQENEQIANTNYLNADTLFRIVNKRYNLGTVTEDELLQMKLNVLNAGAALNSSKVDWEIKKFQLRSFLGLNNNVNLKLIVSKNVPTIQVNIDAALKKAKANSPQIIAMERQLIEADRNVAKAKSEKGAQANLYAKVGYTQQSKDVADVYVNLQDQQQVALSLNIPLLDWGLGKEKFKIAQSNQEVVKANVNQTHNDFVQTLLINVMQFNLQNEQLVIAIQSDTIAQKRYDMTKSRFLNGEVDILDLNVARSEKDQAKSNYISALRNFWNSCYILRKITLYDFINNKELNIENDLTYSE